MQRVISLSSATGMAGSSVRGDGGDVCIRCCSSAIALSVFSRADAAEQQVVEDQTERVDVGPLIDGLPRGLLRRHVLDRADDRADHRVRRGDGAARARRNVPAAPPLGAGPASIGPPRSP